MKKLIMFLPILLVIAALIPPAQAAPLQESAGLYATYDTYIYNNAPDTNYGTEGGLIAAYDLETDSYNSLVMFDLSAIPSNAIVTSATLRLYMIESIYTNVSSVLVYRVKRNWTETDATWNKYDGTNAWQTAGGGGPNDIDYSALGYRTFVEEEEAGAKEFDLDTVDIQNMINGTYQNYGFLLGKDAAGGNGQIFASSEDETEAYRPFLYIEYDIPTATPTPTETVTPTVTVTPTETAIPWNLPVEWSSNDLWDCTEPLSDLYQDGSGAFECAETSATGGGAVYFQFNAVPAPTNGPHEVRFDGYYTGTHTVTLGCGNWETEELYTLATLEPGRTSDEEIDQDLPDFCISESSGIVIYVYQEADGNPDHDLYVDHLWIYPDMTSDTPTPTPAATPLPGEVTTTVTYGDVANFAGLMLIAGVLGLTLIYNVVSSIVFRKRN